MASFNVGAAIGSLLTGIGGLSRLQGTTAGQIATTIGGAVSSGFAGGTSSPSSPFVAGAPAAPLMLGALPARIAEDAPGPEEPGANPWGVAGRWVSIAGRALEAYERARMQERGLDIFSRGNVAEEEAAKILARYGGVPAGTDLGRLAIRAGAPTRTVTVTFSDGHREPMRLAMLGRDTRGTRARRKNLTTYRLGTAAWVMRRLHAQQKLGRRLAAVAARLYPRKVSRGRNTSRKGR